MIRFGFMDNAIMILAGEIIELKIGAIFSISTMAAAAIGNLISDVAGVGMGSYVEKVARKIGFKEPNLSPEQVILGDWMCPSLLIRLFTQMELRSTQIASNAGAAFGVSLGCFLGMFPLLFYSHPGEFFLLIFRYFFPYVEIFSQMTMTNVNVWLLMKNRRRI